MVSPISGIFNTSNLGPAIASVGNDVAIMSRQENRQDWKTQLEKMELEYKRSLFELKQSLAGGKAGKGGQGDGPLGEDFGNFSAPGGALTDPEAQRAKDFKKSGPQTGYIGEPGESTGNDAGAYGETGKSFEDRKLYNRYAGGQRQQLVGPENQETLQKSDTGRRENELTLDAPDMKSALEGGRRVNTRAGKGEYHAGENTTTNTFTGDAESTPLGKSNEAENRAQAGAQGALSRQRDRGQDTSHLRTLDQVEKEISKVQSLIRDYERDQGRKIQDPKSPQYQSYADAKDRLSSLNLRRDDLLAAKPGGESSPGGQTSKEAPDRPNRVSRPKDKAEYDKLPSGALYVSPKDGKTYRKP